MSEYYDDFIEDGEEGYASELMTEEEIDKLIKETFGDAIESIETEEISSDQGC